MGKGASSLGHANTKLILNKSTSPKTLFFGLQTPKKLKPVGIEPKSPLENLKTTTPMG